MIKLVFSTNFFILQYTGTINGFEIYHDGPKLTEEEALDVINSLDPADMVGFFEGFNNYKLHIKDTS